MAAAHSFAEGAINGQFISARQKEVSTMLVEVEWVRQGQIRWGEGWVEQHGHTMTRAPGLDDHISFVNFDLQNNGFPYVEKRANGSLVIEVALSANRSLLGEILGYHGFIVC